MSFFRRFDRHLLLNYPHLWALRTHWPLACFGAVGLPLAVWLGWSVRATSGEALPLAMVSRAAPLGLFLLLGVGGWFRELYRHTQSFAHDKAQKARHVAWAIPLLCSLPFVDVLAFQIAAHSEASPLFSDLKHPYPAYFEAAGPAMMGCLLSWALGYPLLVAAVCGFSIFNAQRLQFRIIWPWISGESGTLLFMAAGVLLIISAILIYFMMQSFSFVLIHAAFYLLTMILSIRQALPDLAAYLYEPASRS